MKIAKSLAIMFALVIVVFCFNVSTVVGVDEHPWDEEDGDDGGDGSDLPDGDDPNEIDKIILGGGNDDGGLVGKFISIQFIIWYYDLPGDKVCETVTTKVIKGSKSSNISLK